MTNGSVGSSCVTTNPRCFPPPPNTPALPLIRSQCGTLWRNIRGCLLTHRHTSDPPILQLSRNTICCHLDSPRLSRLMPNIPTVRGSSRDSLRTSSSSCTSSCTSSLSRHSSESSSTSLEATLFDPKLHWCVFAVVEQF